MNTGGVTALVFLCITAIVVAGKQCALNFDKVSSMLTLEIDTSMIFKPGPIGPSGPPGIFSKDELKALEDRIDSLLSKVKELKEKVETIVNPLHNRKIVCFSKLMIL